MALDLIEFLEKESDVEEDDDEELGMITSGSMIKRSSIRYGFQLKRGDGECSTNASSIRSCSQSWYSVESMDKLPSREELSQPFRNIYSRNKAQWHSA